MRSQEDSLAKIHSTLTRLRQEPATRRRFPKEVWESIIRLTKLHSIEELCQRLQISPIYLKRKIRQALEPAPLEFREVSPFIPSSSSDSVVIELSSNSGLKAKIQGPLSIINCLQALFKD